MLIINIQKTSIYKYILVTKSTAANLQTTVFLEYLGEYNLDT